MTFSTCIGPQPCRLRGSCVAASASLHHHRSTLTLSLNLPVGPHHGDGEEHVGRKAGESTSTQPQLLPLCITTTLFTLNRAQQSIDRYISSPALPLLLP